MARVHRLHLSVWLRALLGWALAGGSMPICWASDHFETHVAPLLIEHCLECHQGADAEGELALTSAAGLTRGGASGSAVDPDAPDQGVLLSRIQAGEMPPERHGIPGGLEPNERRILAQWLLEGAPWPEGRTLDWFERSSSRRAGRDWWSLQPVSRPSVPRGRHPVDAFVDARLQAAGMVRAPRADRRTLLRRAYYTLLGLPPTEAQTQAFLADTSDSAWSRTIDELLARPQYGERWARFWLDVARYADTSGYERDQEKPFAWKYRDWVINALNSDLPYRDFVMQQLAGDELPERTKQTLVATGFLRLGSWNDEPNRPEDYVFDRLEDMVHTTSVAFLGLTVKCARCHAHKFDPITQEDYYRIASAFWAGPIQPRSGDLLGGPSDEELGEKDVLAWTDISPRPTPMHILHNGDRTQPRATVEPGPLSAIPALHQPFSSPPPDAATTGRRRQLAAWMVHPQNPLTPRVIVNRLWQHDFGQGLVRTPNNFGFLADPPTHPQLLDWLASEFLARGQSIKSMHRLLLTSSTWQQASEHPQQSEYEQRDAGNRLWWRAQRRRQDAEALRDAMLFASGELNQQFGGESFKPTIPDAALAGLSRKSAAWQPSPPLAQQRRSVYMFLKRGLLPPLMTTFDMADATLSCGARAETIVPTQALALLNNEFVIHRSRHLAQQLLHDSPTLAEQVHRSWRAVLGRLPTVKEAKSARQFLAQQRQSFRAAAEVAVKENPSVAVGQFQDGLQLHLHAGPKEHKDGRVSHVEDRSGHERHATQVHRDAQPVLRSPPGENWLAWGFDGRQFLEIAGAPLARQTFTIVCVARDAGKSSAHRALVSNWNASGNTTSSLFLGLTDRDRIRLSDAFAHAGTISQPQSPFQIMATNGTSGVQVYVNGQQVASQENALVSRRLDTPWVIGQQGNIGGEFWQGEIAEVRVYDRVLRAAERQALTTLLSEQYGLPKPQRKPRAGAGELALASLCHVLLNSNEFAFID